MRWWSSPETILEFCGGWMRDSSMKMIAGGCVGFVCDDELRALRHQFETSRP
jgi:hypothetical protein